MQNKNLIRFVASLVLVPSLSLSMQLGTPQIVLSQKENKEAQDLQAELTELTAARALAIDTYFKAHGMPLAGLGKKMVEEADKNGLDWRLLPAISVRESTGGIHACKKASHNFFGWGSCKISFESAEKAIEVLARNLGGNNPKTEQHYSGKTTVQILRKYNPPAIVPKYAEQVLSIMSKIGPEMITLDKPESSSDLLAQKG